VSENDDSVYLIYLPAKRWKAAVNLATSIRHEGVKNVYLVLHKGEIDKNRFLEMHESLVEFLIIPGLPLSRMQKGRMMKYLGVLSNSSFLCRVFIGLDNFFQNLFQEIEHLPPFSSILTQLQRRFENTIEATASEIERVILPLNKFQPRSKFIFLLEGDRSVFEMPVLYLKKKGEYDIAIFLIEIAESGTEQDLSLLRRQSKIGPVKNSYYKRNLETITIHKFLNKSYYRSFQSVAITHLGIDSRNPWRVGSNRLVNATFHRSRYSCDSMLAEYPNDKTHFFVGNPLLDEIWSQMKNESTQKAKADPLTRVSRVALLLPQFKESSEEFCRNHRRQIDRDLKNFVINLMRHFNEVLICLHPKQKPEDYIEILSIPGTKLNIGFFWEAIIASDFVASTESSTLQVSWLLQKPVILFLPTYWLLYSLYFSKASDRPWNLVVDEGFSLEKDNLEALYQNAASYYKSPQFRRGVKAQMFDGEATQRVLSKISEIVKG
jgi:hypothetical protein